MALEVKKVERYFKIGFSFGRQFSLFTNSSYTGILNMKK